MVGMAVYNLEGIFYKTHRYLQYRMVYKLAAQVVLLVLALRVFKGALKQDTVGMSGS